MLEKSAIEVPPIGRTNGAHVLAEEEKAERKPCCDDCVRESPPIASVPDDKADCTLAGAEPPASLGADDGDKEDEVEEENNVLPERTHELVPEP